MTASPDVLATSLNAIKNSQARQRPVIMITYTADGPPRVCVPDIGELRVIDGRLLHVAIWPDSPTAADLDRGVPVLLIVPAAPDVHLIRATARRLTGAAMVWAHFDLTITSARIAARGTAPAPFTQPVRPSEGPDTSGEPDARGELLTSVRQKRLVRSLS
ncbi:hypothetical protein E1287_41490 [Actinomadura sp. KC06]|uniref:hypothetical protein n=1 Tax=Actinomadura sp. KC06 TaxID=2530369 RepID=UPI001049A3EB|nr:hypothetical protein [Actinomadura sp. KC06]TDD20248.1 hypothetical protein E1287_41490 [Actinomadura sp. KC06]